MSNPIYSCLWYDDEAKAAATFYCSIFKNSKITFDSPMVVKFELNGTPFMGLNGGPHFKFTEATSQVLECDTQDEIDYYWDKLTGNGGKEVMCGWLTDQFGMSWQVVPTVIGRLMSDPQRAPRVMQVLQGMKKIDIKALENA
jgi:predicted 3-demethylubiquinone-9 3-methyltransferase (glyoxalase superfamily)